MHHLPAPPGRPGRPFLRTGPRPAPRPPLRPGGLRPGPRRGGWPPPRRDWIRVRPAAPQTMTPRPGSPVGQAAPTRRSWLGLRLGHRSTRRCTTPGFRCARRRSRGRWPPIRSPGPPPAPDCRSGRRPPGPPRPGPARPPPRSPVGGSGPSNRPSGPALGRPNGPGRTATALQPGGDPPWRRDRSYPERSPDRPGCLPGRSRMPPPRSSGPPGPEARRPPPGARSRPGPPARRWCPRRRSGQFPPSRPSASCRVRSSASRPSVTLSRSPARMRSSL